MTDLLKPCPFCAGSAHGHSEIRDGYDAFPDDIDAKAYWFQCSSCAAQGGWSKTPAGAMRLWNMRTKSSEGPAE